MTVEHLLQPFFAHVASQLTEHGSPIGAIASDALIDACQQPLAKAPKRLAQCDDFDALLLHPQSVAIRHLQQASNTLHWSDSEGARKPAEVQQRQAFVELLGPTGMIFTERCRVGLFLQSPHNAYPAHRHAAEELYLVLSGTALWHREHSKPKKNPPGSLVHHASWEVHAMTTQEQALLALWCWAGDIAYEKYEIVEPQPTQNARF